MVRERDVREILDAGITDGLFSRGSVRFFDRGKNLLSVSAGGSNDASIYDVASLTKVYAAYIFSLARCGGLVEEEDTAGALLGLPPDSPLYRVTMRDLLSHTAGLPPWRPLYEILLEEGGARKKMIQEERKRLVIEQISSFHTGGGGEKRIIYSDLGYILLGFSLESATGKSLDSLLEEWVARPLGLHDTCYLPLTKIPHCDAGRIVGTGFCPVRGREKMGEVDDLNCYALGGVSGHAGVFSTPMEMELFGRHLISECAREVEENRDGPLSCMLQEVHDSEGRWRFLGFDVVEGEGSLAGVGCSPLTGGHLGWTGTSMWMDFGRGKGVVFLTDRAAVVGDQEKFNEVRRKIHSLAWSVADE